MKSLKERLKERAIKYRRIVRCEKEAQEIIDNIDGIIPNCPNTSITIYDLGMSFITIYIPDIIEFEATQISVISDFYNRKWEKNVYAEYVSYTTSIREFRLLIIFQTSDACIITKTPTGRTVAKQKIVYTDEPEYNYHIDCGEEE